MALRIVPRDRIRDGLQHLLRTRDLRVLAFSMGAYNFGYNVGGGVRFALSGFSAYVEARYHSISNANVSFVPLVFGLQF